MLVFEDDKHFKVKILILGGNTYLITSTKCLLLYIDILREIWEYLMSCIFVQNYDQFVNFWKGEVVTIIFIYFFTELPVFGFIL